MSEDRTVEILKNAILLEKRGNAFYQKVSEQASGKAVKSFFEMMADEAVKHVKILVRSIQSLPAKSTIHPG